MDYRKGILLGKIVKVNGFGGTLSLRPESGFISEDLHLTESVFLVIEGRPVPFFIESHELTGNNTIKLTFTGYNSVNSVAGFVGTNVYSTTITDEIDSKSDFILLTGYTVLSPEKRVTGVVSEVIENPAQILLVVISPDNREILIPLHEDFILSINRKKKQIVMDLPEGIEDLN